MYVRVRVILNFIFSFFCIKFELCSFIYMRICMHIRQKMCLEEFKKKCIYKIIAIFYNKQV